MPKTPKSIAAKFPATPEQYRTLCDVGRAAHLPGEAKPNTLLRYMSELIIEMYHELKEPEYTRPMLRELARTLAERTAERDRRFEEMGKRPK